MNPITFTHSSYNAVQFFPFHLTTAVQDMFMGMMSNTRRWKLILSAELKQPDTGHTYFIPANVLPTRELVDAVRALKPGTCLQLGEDDSLIIGYGKEEAGFANNPVQTMSFPGFKQIEFGWHLSGLNKDMLQFDFALLTKGKESAAVHSSNKITAAHAVFIEEGVTMRHTIINAEEGPVYISKNALLMEGVCIRGPLFIGENAVLKMGAKIYGATSIGRYCTVGGEIKNSIMFPFSNKAHDGYLGDSVIGHWCNLGAGTSNSNLKNTAGNIKVTLPVGTYEAGMKCGVLLGDYSKVAINTSINSGTVAGVCANIFGTGLAPKYIPSFSWGYTDETIYNLDKALVHVERWMGTKNQVLTQSEKELITNIYNQTKKK